MIRHISIFTFFDESANGKTKEENIQAVLSYLKDIPSLYPPIRRYQVGRSLVCLPAGPEEAPLFGDLVQIVDYDTVEDANGYLPSDAHRKLQEMGSLTIRKVTVIDFEI